MRQSKIYVVLTILLSFATTTHSQTPESIDLGLSVEWAATNLDASAPEDFGGYYGWADPTGQETTLYPNEFADAEKNIEKCLCKLDIGYIDLMLLHHPGSHDVEAYRTMERYVKEGKIRSLGVSNYYIKEMSEFLPKVNIKPVLDQNEIHPYYQDKAVIEYLHDNGIVVEAWYQLGGRGFNSELMKEPVIMDIARKHGKSLVQTILRWDLQNGVVVIPGSSNPDHQKENISIFDFELTPEEMGRIDSLERREKHDWY